MLSVDTGRERRSWLKKVLFCCLQVDLSKGLYSVQAKHEMRIGIESRPVRYFSVCSRLWLVDTAKALSVTRKVLEFSN